MSYARTVSRTTRNQRWKRLTAAAAAATVLLGGYAAQLPDIATATQISQTQQDWRAVLNVARLVSTNQLVLQLDVLDKPATSYANAVYMLYARRNSQWVPVYTNTGARLISKANGRVTLAPEVISLSDVQARLGGNVDLSSLELKSVAMLRYDTSGQRDRQVQFEQVQSYRTIAQTTTTQLISTTDIGTTPISVTQPISSTAVRQESRFSLTVLQKQSSLKEVIARVSLKPKQANEFLSEQFVGDFNYKLKEKQKAKFVNGLKAGDRVVVRLFTKDNRFIGHSEFELLASNTAVTLVLPDRAADYGIVRTIYGIDANEDFSLDRTARVYDYFTQVTQVQNYRESRVTFFSSAQSLNFQAFEVAGLPAPHPTCVYPASFVSGSYTLVNQVVRVFGSNLATALISLPGQVVRTSEISTTVVSTYEVSQLISTNRQVGVTQGTVLRGDDNDADNDNRSVSRDDDDGRKPRKRNCNQGIGNGAEGCDPGNSRPHGGSNDEGGRTPGGRKN